MNPSSHVESFLHNVQAAGITNFFIWIITAILVLGVICSRMGKGGRFVDYTPNLLTSLGILGTFFGIVIGLMHFDPTDIDHSIFLLLNGLKTAFITSLVGMGSAILFKILSATPFLANKRVLGKQADIGPMMLAALEEQGRQLRSLRSAIAGEEESSLAGQIKLFRSDSYDRGAQLHRLLEDNTNMTRRMAETTESLKRAVSGEEESSIAGQLKLARQDAMDQRRLQVQRFDEFSNKLWQQMQTFAELLSKSATEQVINALKEVITDFNRNLTEQFGENFKELNDAVGKLVEWQENYRLQLEQMGEQYSQGVEAITQTESSVAQISEKSQVIPIVMERLREVIEVNQQQVEELDRHLESFAQVRDRAVEAVPEIQGQIESMIKGVAESTQIFSEGLKAGSEQMLSSISTGTEIFNNEVVRQMKAIEETFGNASRQLAENLNVSGQKVAATLGEGIQSFTTAIDTQLESLKERIDVNSRKLTEGILESTASISTVVSDSMKEYENNVQRLTGNLTTTSDLLAKNTETIRTQLEDTVTDLNNHSRTMVESLGNGVRSLVEDTRTMNDQLKQTGQQLQQETVRIQREVAETIDQMQKRLQAAMEEGLQAQTREMSRFTGGLEQAVEATVKEINHTVNAQMKMIDESMGKEIEMVMKEMGQALARISGQFTEDYKQLVDAMHKVVRRGRAV